MNKSTSGFTIVELLIVVIVIAILAAISLVAYNGIQNRAYDAAVKNDLSTLKSTFEIYEANNGSYYPAGATSTLAYTDTYGFDAAKGAYMTSSTVTSNLVLCVTPTADDYAIVAISKSGNAFYVSKSVGAPQSYTGTWTGGDTINPMCSNDFSSSFTTNMRGYAANDTTNGPWRAWVGGN